MKSEDAISTPVSGLAHIHEHTPLCVVFTYGFNHRISNHFDNDWPVFDFKSNFRFVFVFHLPLTSVIVQDLPLFLNASTIHFL